MRYATVAVLLLLIGCTAKYQVNNLAGNEKVRLDRGVAVYIAVPQDGAYSTKTYSGSGQYVAQSIAAAFSEMGAPVHVGEKNIGSDQAIEKAKAVSAGYLVTTVISLWEHRATEWSGRPSRMAIRLSIIDVATGNQIAASAIEGRSRIMSFTSTSPESLLRDPVLNYVRGLY